MNREDALELFLTLLSNFRYHSSLIDELLEIIGRSGIEDRIRRLLLTRLAFLTQNGLLATRAEEFEPIEDGIYSMHLAGKGFNIRILYAFLPNKQPVLLHAFHERAGKRKTNYQSALPIAKDRLETEMERYNNGK